MKKEQTYEQALEKLEQIVTAFEQDDLSLDQLSSKLKEAKSLLAYCQGKLTKTEVDIKKILDNGKG